jgi:hypothetical protein
MDGRVCWKLTVGAACCDVPAASGDWADKHADLAAQRPRGYRGAVIEEWSRRAGCIELGSWEG